MSCSLSTWLSWQVSSGRQLVDISIGFKSQSSWWFFIWLEVRSKVFSLFRTSAEQLNMLFTITSREQVRVSIRGRRDGAGPRGSGVAEVATFFAPLPSSGPIDGCDMVLTNLKMPLVIHLLFFWSNVVLVHWFFNYCWLKGKKVRSRWLFWRREIREGQSGRREPQIRASCSGDHHLCAIRSAGLIAPYLQFVWFVSDCGALSLQSI